MKQGKKDSVLEPLEAVTEYLRTVKAEVEADVRHGYEPADVFVNAPLALIQVEMDSKLLVCEKALALLDARTKKGA